MSACSAYSYFVSHAFEGAVVSPAFTMLKCSVCAILWCFSNWDCAVCHVFSGFLQHDVDSWLDIEACMHLFLINLGVQNFVPPTVQAEMHDETKKSNGINISLATESIILRFIQCADFIISLLHTRNTINCKMLFEWVMDNKNDHYVFGIQRNIRIASKYLWCFTSVPM